MFTRQCIAMIIVLAFSACQAGYSETDMNEPVKFTVLAEGQKNIGPREQSLEVIDNANDLQQFWNGTRIDKPAPDIDFTTHRVLAVFSGYGSDGCQRMSIDTISEDADAIEVDIRRYRVGEYCTQAIIFPFVLVSIEKTGKPVRLVESDE